MILYVLVAVGLVFTCYHHRGACNNRAPPSLEMDAPDLFETEAVSEGPLHRRTAHGWDLV